MDDGWVRLYRKLVDSRVFNNPGLLKVWIWCLLRAAHAGKWVTIRTGRTSTEVWVEPGSFIFGRESAAEKLCMSPSTVWKRLKKLENMRNCDIDSDSNYSVVSIVNWHLYQSHEKKGTAKGTAGEQRGNTNKNVKNIKNKTYTVPFEEFWSIYPNHRSGKSKAFESWGKKVKPSDNGLIETIMCSVEEHIRKSPDWKKGFIPYATTWLNQERWTAEFEGNQYKSF